MTSAISKAGHKASPDIDHARAGTPGEAVSEAPPAGDEAPLAAIANDDALAACLAAFLALTDRPVSSAALLAGLPLEDGRLTPALMQRALVRAGYAASLVRRPLAKITNLALPAILFLGESDACILISRADRHFEIADPLTGGSRRLTRKELEQDYAGVALLARRRADVASLSEDVSREGRGHWFWSAVRLLWPTYMFVFLAAALINVIALASPLFVMNVYDRVLPNKAIPTLWVLASGMGIALIFDYMLKSLRSWLIDTGGRRADVLLASRIYAHVLAIEMSQKPRTTGSFASQLKEFESVREFFTSSTIASIADMFFFGIFLLVIYLIGGILVVVPAAAALILILAGLFYQFPLRRAAERHAAETAQRHSLLVETIAGLETVKSIRSEGFLQRKWEGLVGLTSRTVERVRQLNTSLANLTSLVQQLVSVAVVMVGAYLFQEGKMSTGAIVASVMLASRAVAPLGQFALMLARSQQSLASLKSLNTVMSMPSERDLSRTFISEPISNSEIQLRNAVFSYPGSAAPAVNDVTLSIRPGEKVGIIGKIGSGKTTLGRLLTKLYEPQEGAIMIGGVDMRQYHPHEVRRVVGLLGQDTELFHGTVRSNILMANPRATDDQMLAAARLAGVDDFVRRHPAGYEMQVGERGQSLSGGQRQSIALARLLVAEPQVIYLDEPSSAMDLASERVMIEQLRRALRPDQTVIVSTHRYSMLDLVNRLIVINAGKIVADGPKEQVLDALRKQMAPKKA
jgi:ATP-binding cassette, subfamily C, bacterial LapB